MPEEHELRESLQFMVEAAEAGSDLSEPLRAFKQAFLRAGLNTEENRAAVGRLDFSAAHAGNVTSTELRLVPSRISLGEVLNCLEKMNRPDPIRSQLPALSEDEWRAALRATTMILCAFQVRRTS